MNGKTKLVIVGGGAGGGRRHFLDGVSEGLVRTF